MSNVKDDISERINIFHMCTYKSLVICAKTLEIIFISDYQAHGMLLQILSMYFDTFPNNVHITLNIEAKIENIFTFIQDNAVNVPVYCKWSKLIFIQVTLVLTICR